MAWFISIVSVALVLTVIALHELFEAIRRIRCALRAVRRRLDEIERCEVVALNAGRYEVCIMEKPAAERQFHS